MQGPIPRVALGRTVNRSERFAHTRSDGRRVVFGFTSAQKAREFLDSNGLTGDWEPVMFDPPNLRPWLSETLPHADLLALDAQSPPGELHAVEIERAIRAIQSQSAEGPVEVEYEHFEADRQHAGAR